MAVVSETRRLDLAASGGIAVHTQRRAGAVEEGERGEGTCAVVLLGSSPDCLIQLFDEKVNSGGVSDGTGR